MNFLELAEQVIAQRDRDGVRGLDRELSRWRRHVSTATFASKDVREIAPPEIREWLRTMMDKRAMGPGEERTLARQTVSRCQSLVSAIFAEAVDRDILTTNPCLGVKLKKRVDERDTREKWAFLKAEEQSLIYGCAAIPYEDRLMIQIAADTGMRQGEMRHLEIGDVFVDGMDPHITIRIAGRDRRDRTKRLPTKSGKQRSVPLFLGGLAAMRAWMDLLPAYCPSNPEGIVFPAPSGAIRHSGKFFGKSDTLRGYYRSAGIKPRPYLRRRHRTSWRSRRRHRIRSGISSPYSRPRRRHRIHSASSAHERAPPDPRTENRG